VTARVDDDRLIQLDAEIRRLMGVMRRTFGELVQCWNRRDDLRDQYHDRRHPPAPERARVLEELLRHVQTAIQLHERMLTDADEHCTLLQGTEARLTAQLARERREHAPA